MRNTLRLMLVGLPCLALAACVPESEHPITEPGTSEQQPDLYGVWTLEDEKSVQYLHVGAETERPLSPYRQYPERGLMRFVLVTHDLESKQVGDPLEMRFFVSKVGENTYANLFVPPGPDEVDRRDAYWFMWFRLEGDQLLFRGMGLDDAAKVVDQGALEGEVVREEGEVKSVRFTSSSEDIARYLAGEGNEVLFPATGRAAYHRLR